MNKQYLSIFQKYHTRKHARDLEKLQRDLSSRGLLNSGIYDEEIKKLSDNFRDEIEMKKEEYSAEQETERKERNDRIFSRFINTVSTRYQH